MKILIVDDDAFARLMLRMMLEGRGHAPHTFLAIAIQMGVFSALAENNRMPGLLTGACEQYYGRIIGAPPDERGGNGLVHPTAR